MEKADFYFENIYKWNFHLCLFFFIFRFSFRSLVIFDLSNLAHHVYSSPSLMVSC